MAHDAGSRNAHDSEAPGKLVHVVCLSIDIPEPVKFDPGAVTPKPQSAPLLDELARRLKIHPKACVELEGHADRSESDTQRLSVRRAEEVKRQLVSRGVEAGRIRVRGFGAGKPYSPLGERNRRVEWVPKDDCMGETGRQ